MHSDPAKGKDQGDNKGRVCGFKLGTWEDWLSSEAEDVYMSKTKQQYELAFWHASPALAWF